MQNSSRVYVAGHRGLVGGAIRRRLEAAGFDQLLLADRDALDLTDRSQVEAFFEQQKPEYVFLAAAKVGGIEANRRRPADFLRVNLQIQTNVIDAAYRHDCTKLLFLGSSCIYPKMAAQPMAEEALLTGPLEPTNDAYAIAKISGLMMCDSYNRQYGTSFIGAMPTNLYGPGDNFDLRNSHVLPALLRKFHEAKHSSGNTVQVWGTGKPRREFLYVEDLAEACVFLMQNFTARDRDMFVNVGTGVDLTITELVQEIRTTVGFTGEVEWDTSMPDGTPRKLLNVDRLKKLGWQASTTLEHGIKKTYAWFLEQHG